jgi:glyoxylase-like metal-dependent hydrolase (beta-lactamase superfamily II)
MDQPEVIGLVTCMTKTIGRLCDQSSVRQLHLDDMTLTYIVDGAMGMTPSLFFGSIPPAYWRQHKFYLNADGRVPMSAGGLLIERDGHRVLIDTGLGPVVSDDRRMSCNSGDLLKTLAAIDIRPDDIETVAFTHLHLDHAGWAFVNADSGAGRRPTFPEAEYVLADAEMRLLDRNSEHSYTRDGRTLSQSLRELCRLTLIKDGDEIAPGITAMVTPGHTPGHTSYVVSSKRGRRVVAFGDAFHTPAQISHTAWTSDPDDDPKAVPGARTRIIAELLVRDTVAFACHFGDQPFGRVVRTPRGGLTWLAMPTAALLPPPRQL